MVNHLNLRNLFAKVSIDKRHEFNSFTRCLLLGNSREYSNDICMS